jgi:hypothetical protein
MKAPFKCRSIMAIACSLDTAPSSATSLVPIDTTLRVLAA